MTGEERAIADFHGMFWKDSFEYLKPRPSSCHAPLNNDTKIGTLCEQPMQEARF